MECVIGELIQSYKALFTSPQVNPLDLRITNFTIALLGSATLLIIAPFLGRSLISFGMQALSFPAKPLIPLNPFIVDLKEIIEENARLTDLAVASTQAQTALLVLLAASCVLGALVAYRHYKHPKFYTNAATQS